MLTIVETAQFLREAAKLFSEEEKAELVDFLSSSPLAGEEIVGSGGLRKVRFAVGNKGKSGGARVIYFYYSQNAPLYIITCYGKSGKSNLSKAEINSYATLTAALKAHHRKD